MNITHRRRRDSDRSRHHHAVLGFVAIANLFSKQIATIYGILFTLILFVIFTVSEHINRKKRKGEKHGLEEFNLDLQPEVATTSLRARPGSILVAVRDATNLSHLRSVLQKTNMRRHDIVVMTVRQISDRRGRISSGGEPAVYRL